MCREKRLRESLLVSYDRSRRDHEERQCSHTCNVYDTAALREVHSEQTPHGKAFKAITARLAHKCLMVLGNGLKIGNPVAHVLIHSVYAFRSQRGIHVKPIQVEPRKSIHPL